LSAVLWSRYRPAPAAGIDTLNAGYNAFTKLESTLPGCANLHDIRQHGRSEAAEQIANTVLQMNTDHVTQPPGI
jgi:hypothetical protein